MYSYFYCVIISIASRVTCMIIHDDTRKKVAVIMRLVFVRFDHYEMQAIQYNFDSVELKLIRLKLGMELWDDDQWKRELTAVSNNSPRSCEFVYEIFR